MSDIVHFLVVNYKGKKLFKIESNNMLIDNITTASSRLGTVQIFHKRILFDKGYITEYGTHGSFTTFYGFKKLQGDDLGAQYKNVIRDLKPEMFKLGDKIIVDYQESSTGNFAQDIETIFYYSLRRKHILSQLKIEYFDLNNNKKIQPFYPIKRKKPHTWEEEIVPKKEAEASFLNWMVDDIINQVYNHEASQLDIVPPLINYEFTVPEIKMVLQNE